MALTDELERVMKVCRVRLPGALDDGISFEMFEAAREFFQQSEIWQVDIDFDVTTDETDYIIATNPPGFEGTGYNSGAYQVGDFWAAINTLMYVKNGDIYVAATMEQPGLIVLDTEPSEAGTYTARVSLSLVNESTEDVLPWFPNWVLPKYSTAFIEGTLSRMMSQIAKPYTSERMAIFHGRRFQTEIAMARVDSRRKNVFGSQRWAFPQGFARVTKRQ